jgi:hypothetical protein
MSNLRLVADRGNCSLGQMRCLIFYISTHPNASGSRSKFHQVTTVEVLLAKATHILKRKGCCFRPQESQMSISKQEIIFVKLGPGPMRFGPVRQACSVQSEVEFWDRSYRNIKSFAAIKGCWDTEHIKQCKNQRFTNAEILRIVVNFDKARAIRLLKKTDPNHFQPTVFDINDDHLSTQAIFPVPDLKRTRVGNNVVYVRPSKFSSKTIQTSGVVDHLIYVIRHA